MKIAIVGTTGMLGYAMSKYLRAHSGDRFSEHNIAEGGCLEEIIKGSRYCD